jgi:hypothetical protein
MILLIDLQGARGLVDVTDDLVASLATARLRFSSPNTSRTSFRIFLSGWFAGTRASGEMYENSRP